MRIAAVAFALALSSLAVGLCYERLSIADDGHPSADSQDAGPGRRDAGSRFARADIPDPTALTGVQAGSLAQDGSDLLVSRDGRILRIPPKGQPIEIARVDDSVKRIVPAGSDVFFASRRSVYRVPRAGGAPVVVMEAPPPATTYMPENTILGIAVDDEELYVSAGQQVLRVRRAGGGEPVVMDQHSTGIPVVILQGPRVIEAAGPELRRFARAGGDVLRFADLAGTERNVLIPDVAEDGADLVAIAGKRVVRVKADASVVELGRFEQPMDLAVDADAIYVADRGQGLLRIGREDNRVTVVDARPATNVVQSESGLAWISVAARDTVLVRAAKPRPSAPAKGTPPRDRLTCRDGLYTACLADCDRGDGEACVTAAAPLLDGRGGFKRDFAAGLPLLRRGCDAKKPSVKACSLAAALLNFDSPPLKADKNASLALLERACALDARECAELARTLEWDPARPDVARARTLRGRACDAGNAGACEELSSDLKRAGDTTAAKAAHDQACALNPSLFACRK